jgi:hypothetical protein
MSRSLKVTHVFLMAAFVVGISACSGEGDLSAASPSPAPAVSTAPSVSASASPAASETAVVSTSPPVSLEPTPETSSAGVSGPKPDFYLVGVLSANVEEPGSITVQLDEGEVQPVVLSRTAVVLDVKGTICSQGKLPHKCTVQQLERALASGKTPHAKVMVTDGIATRIEETAGS